MKIAIYSRSEIVHREEELRALFGAFGENKIAYCLNRGFAEIVTRMTGIVFSAGEVYDALPEDVGMVLSYGGDGTFLDTVRLLDTRPVPVLGINYGHLGFLANVAREEMAQAIAEVAAGKYTVEERLLLHVEGDFGQLVTYPYAFNEFSLQKNGVAMITVDVYINDELITSYLGDGLILSSPTGSTAYSLSVGGPILAPDCKGFVLAPIASHNLTMRPLVVPDTSEMRFQVHSRVGSSIATLDSRDYTVADGSGFTVKKAKKSAFLVKLQNISFYRTLRDKMMWGVDSRAFRSN